MAYLEQAGLGLISSSRGIVLPTYTVAQLPAAGIAVGVIVYCSNGSAGQETLVLWNGTNWIALATGATASAT
jgi:hypothetical protein